jgi:hypothetical protein
MALTLSSSNHGDLCHGWSWTVTDEDALAERVARIVLGQYRHVAKILAGAGIPGPPLVTAEQAKAAIQQLTVRDGEDPWQRDGWIFQAISWIAAHQAPSGEITRAPHIRKSDKGFDGIQLQLSADGAAITAVVVFEDKATENPRDTIREEVWRGIARLENGDRLNELTHEVSAMLGVQAAADPQFDVDSAIATTLWREVRRYRVSITIGDPHNSDKGRAKLFEGFDNSAPGAVERRRADTIYLPALRSWMTAFAARVIAKIQAIAHV